MTTSAPPALPEAPTRNYAVPVDYRVVWDEPEPCPYRPGETARFPMRVPPRRLTPAELDAQLEAGDRRSGRMLYTPTCPACSACEPIRVSIPEFAPNKSQRRVWQRNQAELTVMVGPPKVDAERIALYNRHKSERGLSRSGLDISPTAYKQWLVDSNCDTREITYSLGERLLAVSVLDVGAEAASSVYVYFDPDESKRALGVYSALVEIAWLRSQGKRWYYLGLYVADCRHLAYKSDYRPNERRVGGRWVAGS